MKLGVGMEWGVGVGGRVVSKKAADVWKNQYLLPTLARLIRGGRVSGELRSSLYRKIEQRLFQP